MPRAIRSAQFPTLEAAHAERKRLQRVAEKKGLPDPFAHAPAPEPDTRVRLMPAPDATFVTRRGRLRADEVFDYIVAYKRRNDGNAPTIREIASGVGLYSSSAAHYYVDLLVVSGRLYWLPGRVGKTRGYGVAGGWWDVDLAAAEQVLDGEVAG